MTLMKPCVFLLGLVLASFSLFAQQNPPATPDQTPAGQQQSATGPSATQTSPAKKVDRAAAYYHYSLAHMYEEMVAMTGRSEYATKAIEEYRLAIDNDPSSAFLNAGLAELYAKTGRIRDAVLEAQDIIKRDPKNLEARKLLGRIYLRSLGDVQAGTQSQEVLKLAIEQYESIVKLEPNNPDNHLLLGRLYILNKDLLKAETEFKTAISQDPNSEEAVTNVAYLYNEEGDSKKAAEILNSVPEGVRTAKMYVALGYTYEQLKDYKKAIAAYRQSITLDHDNLDAVRGLAQNLVNDNQIDAALQQYNVIQEADPEDPQAALRIAEIYRHQGRFDLALENLKKAEAMAQDSLEVFYNEALVLEAQGKFDEAADVLQKLLTRTNRADGKYTAGERNNRALFLERLGNVYREENRPLLAVETFHKIVDLGGDEASRGYQEIIDSYREQKQWSDAARVARDAVSKLPNDKALKLMLGAQLADDGKADEAIQVIKSLLKGTPEDRETYVGLSQIYARLKRWKESEDALAQAEKLSTRNEEKEYVLFLQGSSYERQKKFEQAEQIFRQVLQQDPNNTMTLNYLGYMLADRNTRLEEALTLIKKALALDPQNGAYLDSLGWAYFRLGNYDQSEENLRKAADKTPNDATIQDHLAELYAKTGRLKLAAAHWERALDEWAKSVPADVDQQDVSRVQKKLESTKVKLAQEKQ
ncbi:MAG TPA: tetratricopeptide repeat protein [Candidatus Angelobacter sp.]|nr:tetratricopeptide repeat protein [Candidatus Angelobacter sp.]